jgi:hypothetical protein
MSHESTFREGLALTVPRLGRLREVHLADVQDQDVFTWLRAVVIAPYCLPGSDSVAAHPQENDSLHIAGNCIKGPRFMIYGLLSAPARPRCMSESRHGMIQRRRLHLICVEADSLLWHHVRLDNRHQLQLPHLGTSAHIHLMLRGQSCAQRQRAMDGFHCFA